MKVLDHRSQEEGRQHQKPIHIIRTKSIIEARVRFGRDSVTVRSSDAFRGVTRGPAPARWATPVLRGALRGVLLLRQPAALHDQLRARLVPRAIPSGAFEYDFNLMYGYRAPNIILLRGGCVSALLIP